MSTGASERDTGKTGADAASPLDPDRPFVDGTTASPEELRAEVERLRTGTDEQQYVDELREEVGDSVAELAARLDVKARVTEKKDEAVTRAKTAVADGASTARQKPGVLAAVVAALLVLVLVVLRRRRP